MITTFEELSNISRNGKVIYARGAFDILHAGHIAFINFAKEQGGTLVLGIISDDVIRKNKGENRPVMLANDRMIVANGIKGVDYVFVVPEPSKENTATELVFDKLRPDIFVLYDEVPEYTEHFKKLLSDYDIKIVLDSSEKLTSTSELIEKMKLS
jgi:cytidyltransferase-like protein